MTCSVADCDSPARTRGLCDRHYQRLRKNGDVNVVRRENYGVDAKCSVPDCPKPPLAKRLCRSHYERNSKYGDPLGGTFYTPGSRKPPTPRLPFEERFWAKVDRGGSGCWLWRAHTTRPTNGYGVVRRNGRMQLAHRVAYELLVGPIPEGLDLDHRCRTRLCVNPAHLEPVTPYVNFSRGHSPAAMNARKTHCVRGHLLSGDNLAIVNNGRSRRCLQCKRDNDRARKGRHVFVEPQ